jgi:hypothetical protein
LRFRYNAGIYRFQDDSTFDRPDHAANLALQSQVSRRNNISFDTRFSRGQSQANFADPADPDIILNQRTRRDFFDARLMFESQVSSRWNWRFGGGVGSVRHEDVPGAPSGGVQDREYGHVTTGLDRQVSRKTNVGFELEFLETRFDAGGDEQVHGAGVFMTRQVDRKSRLNLRVGAYTAETAGLPDRSGGSVRLGYQRDFRHVALDGFAGHRPTPGGNLPGTSTDTDVGLALSGVGSRVWRWRLAGQFTRRDPADSTRADIDSRGFNANLTGLAHPKTGLRLTASSVTQSETAVPDIEVFRATLGIVWFPRG